ncbi:MAG: phosphohydrolase [Maritimibacter sp.]|nr:phosphohydrolase [Maritimibacter sp.]
MSRTICIYHANCADGFTAAWVVREALGPEVEFVPAGYGSEPPDVTGADVVIVDFSYPRDVLEIMAKSAASVLVLDHHKTAAKELAGYPEPEARQEPGWFPEGGITCIFDMDRSGAQIAWDFFWDGHRPALVEFVADRDLWKWELPDSRAVSAWIRSQDMDFDTWSDMAAQLQDKGYGRAAVVAEGEAILRAERKLVGEVLDVTTRMMTIGGYRVPVANAPYALASDTAGRLAEGNPFAATYIDTPNGRAFSLRSRAPDGLDVSEIARIYGGGGHRNAAGFKRALGWEGDE